MTLYIKGTDVQIIGTLEKMTGTGLADSLADDGTIIWSGETKIDFDQTETIIQSGIPVWVDADGSIYSGVTVEDRRTDGTVVQFAKLEHDPLGEIDDLLHRLIGRASLIASDDKASPAASGWAHVLHIHLSNCARGLEKLRKPVVEEAVKAHDGYVG